eukprot:16876-Eustigmatos_ZCMA.PRE.1
MSCLERPSDSLAASTATSTNIDSVLLQRNAATARQSGCSYRCWSANNRRGRLSNRHQNNTIFLLAHSVRLSACWTLLALWNGTSLATRC